MPYDPTYHAFPGVAKIRAVIARERPDVLEVHSPYMGAIAALGASDHDFGVRTFRWHSDFLDTYAQVFGWAVEGRFPRLAKLLPSPLRVVRPAWGLVRRLAQGMDATLVASRSQRTKLEGHGVARVHHVPFGVDVPRVTEERRAARRAELTMGRPGPLLVGVGRFAVEKRWDVVLEASRRLLPTLPHTLVLFGDGPERARLERAAGSHVRFLGFEKDRERLFSGLAAGDALVHGCPCETFGLSIAEALAAGLPVVVPRAGGAFDLADPTVSETYEPLDASACAAAVRRLLGRDREELGRAARAFAGVLPSHEGEIDALRALYTDLLGARPAPRLASRNPRM